VKPRALQDLVDWQCFACGRLNQRGLRIKSYRARDELVCSWRADPVYVAHRRQGREIREPIDFTYGTESFRLDLLKPFPLESAVTFGARVSQIEGDGASAVCSAYVDDTECARGEADLVRFVPR
jgi:hypothetical protein